RLTPLLSVVYTDSKAPGVPETPPFPTLIARSCTRPTETLGYNEGTKKPCRTRGRQVQETRNWVELSGRTWLSRCQMRAWRRYGPPCWLIARSVNRRLNTHDDPTF